MSIKSRERAANRQHEVQSGDILQAQKRIIHKAAFDRLGEALLFFGICGDDADDRQRQDRPFCGSSMLCCVRSMFFDVSPAVPVFPGNRPNTILKYGGSYSAMQTSLVYDAPKGKALCQYHLYHHENRRRKKILADILRNSRWAEKDHQNTAA